MTVLPFMSRAWAFLFNNVYAHDVHKRRLTLRIIHFRHLRPPLPQERATGSPYPSRRTIIRTGSVASLLEARSPTGPHFVYGNLTSESHPIAEAHLPRSTEPHVHLVGQRPAPRTSVPCALQMGLRLPGWFLAQLRRCARAYVHLVGQRPAPRTSAPCALQMGLRLPGWLWLYAPCICASVWLGRLWLRAPCICASVCWGGCGCRLPAVSGRMEAIAE